MIKKVNLKERSTNENIYPLTSLDCVQDFPQDGQSGQILITDGQNLKWTDVNVINILAYGVEWNATVADPHITRVGNLSLHRTLPIQSKMRGCIAKKVGDKFEIQYYLDADNWNNKEDGTASRLDGYDGEVMVEVPQFYYRSWDETSIKRVMISETKIGSDWIESPRILVGAYRSTVLNTIPTDMGYLSTLPVNSAISVKNTADYCRGGSNSSTNDKYFTGADGTTIDAFRTQLGKPRTYLSRSNMRIYSRNGGKEMLSYDQYKNIFYWLYVIEYANFHSQEAFNDALTVDGYKQGGLGVGVTALSGEYWDIYSGYYPIIPCGYCDELGNRTGVKAAVFPSIQHTSTLNTSMGNYTKNAFVCTISNGVMTITKINSNNTSGTYASRKIQSGETIYKVEGLQDGQSLIFYKGSTILGTISTDGNITIDWGSDSVNRSIKASFIGDCNINLSIVSASQVTYNISGYTVQVPRWRGFDNPFGDIWTNLDGIIIDADADNHPNNMNYVYTCQDPTKYADNLNGEGYEKVGEEIHQEGYTKLFDLGDAAHIIPKVMGANTTTYKCDYHWVGSKNNTLRTLFVGGGAYNGGLAGLGCFFSFNGVSDSDAIIGFRSVFSFLSFSNSEG